MSMLIRLASAWFLLAMLSVSPTQAATTQIMNSGNHLCLGVAGSSTASRAPVTQIACGGGGGYHRAPVAEIERGADG